MAIAERLSYRPNQAAKAVRTGRFGSIGLIVPAAVEGRHLPADLLDGILEETEARDLHLAVAREPVAGARPARLWRERAVDGVLWLGAMPADSGAPHFSTVAQVPSIALGSALPQACVYPDDVAAGRQATVLLRRLGHRRIAYVGASVEHPFVRGYRHGLEGLPAQVVVPPGADRAHWARVLLSSPNRPSAMLCALPADALMVMQVAAEMGIAIPQALSLITIDAVAVDVHAHAGPTRMALPFRAIGRLGVTQLIARIAEPTRELLPLAVAYELRDGGTCAPPMD